MEKKSILEKYSEWIEFSQMKYDTISWISISIGLTTITGIISFVITTLIINEFNLIPFAFSIATLVLTLGYPYLKKESIINTIENNFSDALKQMADTLKAGDTYESALKEVVDANYGRLSEEMQLALRRLEEGENIDTALTGFSNRIDSRLVKRTITIILDSIKSGASLADVLDEIAEDVKEFQRLKSDREANTMMQFLFMIASGGFIAPLIFGEINAVTASFSVIGAGNSTTEQAANAAQLGTFMIFLSQIYIVIEVIGCGCMMSTIRKGKFNRSIIYIPILLVIAFIMYYVATFLVRGMIPKVG